MRYYTVVVTYVTSADFHGFVNSSDQARVPNIRRYLIVIMCSPCFDIAFNVSALAQTTSRSPNNLELGI